MQKSKYEPLHRYLRGHRGSELPVSFKEVERVLGFPLPDSARRHAAWWSNNKGTNVAVSAWRDAGWRTAQVDVPNERLKFVRESNAAAVAGGRSDREIAGVDLSALSESARSYVREIEESFGLDAATAVAAIVTMAARRARIERVAAASPLTHSNSADLVREMRDAR